ncbi:carboxylate-amine ligase [Planotetraspora kaengkrachanensis]|uniref:Putative glutamate--cysteine ligase 2 n=1 Tax=Planotetraspora kaengkrachanensis TaxID=575193 RepID=A0A8J3PTC6_9ACTN|nr:glutamate--cysteine ligase [Planotetraspora kaengkrachanensis]GIG80749.1 putative glutamate--cysteine ligase 2-2 [Planotetraspora kaengkrachanensis]
MTSRRPVGVEEEFLVVDLESRRLTPLAHAMLDQLPEEGFAAELQRSVVETNSTPYEDLMDVRAELVRLRGALTAAAEPLGVGVIGSGTTPLAGTDGFTISPGERFRYLSDSYQFLAQEQLICGAQVHVEIDDRDVAVLAVQRVEPWLPALLALSASSPYWQDADSGYASSRALAWQRWPTAGPVGPFRSAAEYDQAAEDLVASGVIEDVGMVYFDIRLSAHVPTVELRVCDSCPLVDDVVLIAGLFRALVVRESESVVKGEPQKGEGRVALLRAANWRAARSGLEGDLLSPVNSRPMSAPKLITWLLDDLRPALEELGDWEVVSELADAALRRGSSASRQRGAHARDGRPEDAVDLLLQETRRS